MSASALALIAREEGGRTLLCSPGVGWFRAALPAGAELAEGAVAGELETLGVRSELVVPAGVRGTVASEPPRLRRAPVHYGQVLYELSPLGGTSPRAAAQPATASRAGGELAVRAPQSGRFYHRSAPGEPALCEVGRELEIGTPIGLIEVMKTFTQLVYRAEHGLPPRAKILRVVAADGSDVEAGAPLVTVAAR